MEHIEIDAPTLRELVTQAVGDTLIKMLAGLDMNQFRACRLAELTVFLEWRDDQPAGERVLASSDIGYKHKAVRRLYAKLR